MAVVGRVCVRLLAALAAISLAALVLPTAATAAEGDAGTISGRAFGPGGTVPITVTGDARVVIKDATTGATAGADDPSFGAIGADGRFAVKVPFGTYKLQYVAPGYFSEWYNDAASFESATAITVSAAAPTAVGVRGVLRTTTAPNPPTGVTAVAGFQEALVSWNIPAPGGPNPTSYLVTSNSGETCTSGPKNFPKCIVKGLTNGVEYTFTVTATNEFGTSAPSAPSNVAVPTTSPSAPVNVKAIAGSGAAMVSWDAPLTPQNAAITEYTVTAAPGGRTCTTTGARTCAITGLHNGVSYTFTVQAKNSVGVGTKSSPSNAVTPSVVAGKKNQQSLARALKKKMKAKTKQALLTRSTAGLPVTWRVSTPATCKVKKGRLVAKKKGKCIVTASAASNGRVLPLTITYKVKIKKR